MVAAAAWWNGESRRCLRPEFREASWAEIREASYGDRL
jgi:hypothetical protein